MPPNLINPVIEFYEIKENELFLVREDLIEAVNKIAPELGKEVKTFFRNKIKENGGKPPLGELFPWILKDLLSLKDSTTRQATLGWLALYLYTIFLDECVDGNKKIKPVSILAGSALSKIALFNLTKVVRGTKFETLIDEVLDEALMFQFQDVQSRSKKNSLREKIRYSEGKNKMLLACAGALAATNEVHSDFIIKFTNSILLAFQYLDDISDFKIDFSDSNYTVLLHFLVDRDSQSLYTKFNKVNSNLLLKELIVSGSLLRVVKETGRLISNAIDMIDQLNSSHMQEKSSYQVFSKLHKNLMSLSILLEDIKDSFCGLNKYKQRKKIMMVKRHLVVIAQST